MPKKDSCRKWFCRVTKINNTQNGVYEYDFDELYKTLTEKYNVLFALHDKHADNVHCHIVIQYKNQIEFDHLKKLIPYGDIEKQRGSNKECYEYCLHIDKKSRETENTPNTVTEDDLTSLADTYHIKFFGWKCCFE